MKFLLSLPYDDEQNDERAALQATLLTVVRMSRMMSEQLYK
jgi:hypothetical protein